jgi:hypothetical protein
MQALRRAWTGVIALAVLLIACGSISPVMALAADLHAPMHHQAMAGHHHDGSGKTGGPKVDCGTTCFVVAPTAPFAIADLAPSPPSFWNLDSILAGAHPAPDPPPPRIA